MNLVFLGALSAFGVDQNNFHSNMIINNEKGSRLLIDCGTDIPYSLHKEGLSWNDISHIYVSHLHADHVGGLEWFANHVRERGEGKPTLYLSSHLVEDLWNRALLGGVKRNQDDCLENFFHVVALQDNEPFVWEGITFNLIQVLHYLNGFRIMPSYGLMFEINGKKVFLTTDTQHTFSHLSEYYHQADIIFHDCATFTGRSTVHAHYTDLVMLDPSIKKKMWLYHYDPGKLPDSQKDGFKGFVHRGQVFNLFQ